MARRLRRKTGALRDGFYDVSLDFDRNWRSREGSELRIEGGGDPICALRRKCRRRIEQSEIARMGDVNQSLFHLGDSPRQEILERLRRAEVEGRQLIPERGEVERRRYRPADDRVVGIGKIPRESVFHALAIG